MGDVVNLRQARKARKRAEDSRQAEANRAKYGRTKSERRIAGQDRERNEAALEGARIERPEAP